MCTFLLELLSLSTYTVDRISVEEIIYKVYDDGRVFGLTIFNEGAYLTFKSIIHNALNLF